MGQQQLLLLVLGIVIVGLAVVVGIQAFGENQKKANADALVNDAIRIASDAQAWKLKPAAFGGGAGESGFTSFTLKQAGYDTENAAGTQYKNLNGFFEVTAGANNLKIVATDTTLANKVVAYVVGTQPECIETSVLDINDADGSAPTITGCSL